MSSVAFQIDLTRGQLAEHLLFNRLEELNLEPIIATGFHPDWDIRIKDGRTIEVKWDEMAKRTGNIYLETKALRQSKADYWAIAYGNPITAFYILNRITLRDFAEQWSVKIKGGEFYEPAKIIKRTLFLELLKPKIYEIEKSRELK